jgi:hypothetical protein
MEVLGDIDYYLTRYGPLIDIGVGDKNPAKYLVYLLDNFQYEAQNRAKEATSFEFPVKCDKIFKFGIR